MRNYIIFLILLVPRMQTQGENITSLIDEIDEFFANLRCPQSLINPIVVDFEELEGAPEIDVSTRMRTYSRFKLVDTFRSNPDFKQQCGSEGPAREFDVLPRSVGSILDTWRQKLCYVLNLFNMCKYQKPNSVTPPTILPSETCTPFRQIILDPSGRQKKGTVIRCINGKQESLMPFEEIDGSSSIGSPKPQPEYAICTPINQQKQKQLSCLFNNKTSVIVPMETEDKPKVAPTPAPTPTGNGKGKPDIQVIQSVNVNTGV